MLFAPSLSPVLFTAAGCPVTVAAIANFSVTAVVAGTIIATYNVAAAAAAAFAVTVSGQVAVAVTAACRIVWWASCSVIHAIHAMLPCTCIAYSNVRKCIPLHPQELHDATQQDQTAWRHKHKLHRSATINR